MKAESIQILEKHRAHWLTLRDAGYIKQIEYKDKKELLQVYQDEIDPKEHTNLWCGECVVIMIRRLYTTYENQRVQVTIPTPEQTPFRPGPDQIELPELGEVRNYEPQAPPNNVKSKRNRNNAAK